MEEFAYERLDAWKVSMDLVERRQGFRLRRAGLCASQKHERAWHAALLEERQHVLERREHWLERREQALAPPDQGAEAQYDEGPGGFRLAACG